MGKNVSSLKFKGLLTLEREISHPVSSARLFESCMVFGPIRDEIRENHKICSHFKIQAGVRACATCGLCNGKRKK